MVLTIFDSLSQVTLSIQSNHYVMGTHGDLSISMLCDRAWPTIHVTNNVFFSTPFFHFQIYLFLGFFLVRILLSIHLFLSPCLDACLSSRAHSGTPEYREVIFPDWIWTVQCRGLRAKRNWKERIVAWVALLFRWWSLGTHYHESPQTPTSPREVRSQNSEWTLYLPLSLPHSSFITSKSARKDSTSMLQAFLVHRSYFRFR